MRKGELLTSRTALSKLIAYETISRNLLCIVKLTDILLLKYSYSNFVFTKVISISQSRLETLKRRVLNKGEDM